MTAERRLRVRTTRRLPAAVEDVLKSQFDATLNTDDAPLWPSELADALTQFDILCPTITDRLDEAVFAAPAAIRTRLIANFGAGVNHIDLRAAQIRGVAVTNTPGALTNATADLTLMLILMAARRAGEGERELRAGAWTGWRPTHMMGADLRGRTLGLLGFGRIARAVAARVQPLGMDVLYFRRSTAADEVPTALNARRVHTLRDLLAASDVLSLHAPGSVDTHRIINADAFSHMKPTAFLVNTARGSLVDEAALVTALTAGRIRGAALDVYENEPAIHPALLGLDNVVLMPHLGSATVETREAMGMQMIENVKAFAAGLVPPNLLA